MMLFAAGQLDLQRAHRQALNRGLASAVYVKAMFSTGYDEANRAAFRAEDPEAPELVGLALRGPKNDVDKAIKGAKLHP